VSDIDKAVVSALESAIGQPPVALHEPRFGGRENEYLELCVRSTYVSSVGPFVDRFENDIAQLTGSPFAVAVVNGTSALHISLLLAGVTPGDEVLLPALTFAATANAVVYCGAVPHFVDSGYGSLGVDPGALRLWLNEVSEVASGELVNRRTGRTIRAIVPMHTFGHPCQMSELLEVAEEFGLMMVEDAAESMGSWYGNQHSGTFGPLGVLSFNGNKIITTGGGGAILTPNEELAQRAKHLTTTAKKAHRWEFVHDEVGFNYRMPNLNAALGCAQIEELPGFLASKRRLFTRYVDAFRRVPGIEVFEEPANCRSNYWLQALLLDKHVADQRDAILTATNDAGYMSRPAWTLLPHLAHFSNSPSAPLPCAEDLSKRIINIPSSAGLA
jgi:perosamine synthetase